MKETQIILLIASLVFMILLNYRKAKKKHSFTFGVLSFVFAALLFFLIKETTPPCLIGDFKIVFALPILSLLATLTSPFFPNDFLDLAYILLSLGYYFSWGLSAGVIF